jgi:hypothetical protein
MSTHKKVKAAYFSGKYTWNDMRHRVAIKSGSDMCRVAGVFASLSRYILAAYDTLFVETERGVAVITCVSEEGIRVSYFQGKAKGDGEWIHANDHMGNMDATQRTFVEQPDPMREMTLRVSPPTLVSKA